jgi:hypothetical protein
MPTLAEVRAQYPQYSDMSDVELAGALHSRFYADMPADQFAEKIGLKPDKYQQAALDDKAAGKPMGETRGAALDVLKSFLPAPARVAAGAVGMVDDAMGGQLSDLARLGQQGASFNAMDEIKAGIETPLEMYRRGTLNPLEAFNYAKARENLAIDDARRNTGYAGTAAELVGGAAGGLGLVNSGVTAGRLLSSAAPGLLGRTAVGVADAAAMGGVAGLNEGDSLSDRLSNAGRGAAIGGLVGGALPVAGAAASGAFSPFISNIMARIDPARYARSQVARGISESGRSVDEIAADLASAANDGQGVFTLADAMGNPGQRLLSTTARAPGPGRTAVVDFLENRQAGQGRRVSNALSEGFETPQTAAQTEARMTGARDAVADAEYGAVRSDAKPVDVTNVIANIDRTVSPGTAFHTDIANDSVEAALLSVRNKLTDGTSNLIDFRAVQRVRGDLSDAAQKADRAGEGNKARLLRGALRELDRSMEDASEGYLAANRNFAQASRNIEAVQTGREAATRGRVEDTIPRYQGLTPEGQAAFRAGYADPLIANTQGAAFGANKARPLLNDAFAAEAEAMAPGNAQMQRRLSREQRMFETRNQALGNSKTAENLADADAMGIDPSVVGHIFQGNYGQAVRSLISAGSNAVTGNTPQVREAVANILLQRGGTMTAAELERMVGETVRKIQFVQDLARNSMAAGSGALAVSDQKKINKRAKKIFGVN